MENQYKFIHCESRSNSVVACHKQIIGFKNHPLEKIPFHVKASSVEVQVWNWATILKPLTPCHAFHIGQVGKTKAIHVWQGIKPL